MVALFSCWKMHPEVIWGVIWWKGRVDSLCSLSTLSSAQRRVISLDDQFSTSHIFASTHTRCCALYVCTWIFYLGLTQLAPCDKMSWDLHNRAKRHRAFKRDQTANNPNMGTIFFVILASSSFFLSTTNSFPNIKLVEGSDNASSPFGKKGIQRPFVTEITPDVSLCD